MNHRHRVATPVAMLLMAWLLLFVAPSSAQAATEGDEPEVTWAVSPADAAGPDGRGRVELTADPGATVVEHVAVQNLSKVPVTFTMAAADGYFTDTGRFNMLPDSVASVGAGTWVSIQETVQVEAGKTVVVPYQITVPDNATPGDHVAGLVASYMPRDGGAQVGVNARVGFRIEIRVTGTLTPALEIGQVRTSYDMGWNPFRPGAVEVETDLTNTGNTALVVDAVAGVQGSQASLGHTEGAPTVELLPGDSVMVRGTVQGVWPLVRLNVEVTAEADSGSAIPTLSQKAAQSVWAWPVPQAIVVAGFVLIVLGLVGGRRRNQRRLRSMLDAARAQGRQEVLDGELDDAVEPSGR